MIGRLFDFLFSLQRVHFTSGTRFAFVWDHPFWIMLGAMVLAALGYVFYFPQAASPNKKKVMGIFRGLLLALVFLLVWRPQLVMEHEQRLRSAVAVWVDDSTSMTLEDPYNGAGVDPAMRAYVRKISEQLKTLNPTTAPTATGRSRINRYELATASLKDAQWLKELTDTQDVIFFTGYRSAEAVGTATNPEQINTAIEKLTSAKPTGDTTDVPEVVRSILEKTQGQRISAIVLLTDGQTTEKGSRLDQAAILAQQANTKVFGLPLGQEQEPFDLKLTTMRLPPSTFAKDPISLRMHISAAGVTRPTPVRINVYRKPAGSNGSAADLGAPLATKELILDPTKQETDTELSIKLAKSEAGKGERFDLIARVESAAVGGAEQEELTLNNNQQTGSVTVLDAQINVLYVEGYPRWEFRYLKNELIREPTVNISTLLVSADQDFTQDSDPPVRDKATNEEIFPGPLQHFPDTAKDLAEYDVLLIGDVEPTYFSPTQQKLIIDWVKTRGGGLAWLAGANFNPESYRETPLEVLLPVTPDEIDPRARLMALADNAPYTLVLTPAGRETNLFRFFDDPDESWKQITQMPQMFWYKPVQGLKPGAIVLAVHPTRSQGGNPAPLLVTRQYGAGPVLFSAYCDTWRWRRYTGEPLFQSYWLQLCRLLYANKALGQSKRVELEIESKRVEIGGQIKVSLTVKDPTLVGQLPQEVPVILTDKEGRSVETITLRRSTDEAGNDQLLERLEGTATATQLGEFTLQARPSSLPVDVTPGEVTVQIPQREFENIAADTASLRRIATKTTGAVLPLYRATELTRQIPDRSVPVLNTQSEELWNKPIALMLVLLLATAEWFTRKSAGLI